MRFGLITEAEVAKGTPYSVRYHEVIKEAIFAEEMGFDFWGSSEQHLVPSAYSISAPEVLYGAVAVCVIFPLVFGPELDGPVRRWLASPVPSALGEISYGVFSIHMFVLLMGMELLGFGTFNDRFWTVLGMTLAVTIPIAALSYIFFERRMMRLRGWRPSGRRAKRRPEPEPDAEAVPESESEPGETEAAAATSTIATSENA